MSSTAAPAMQPSAAAESTMAPSDAVTLPPGSVVHPDFKSLTEADKTLEQKLQAFKQRRIQLKQQYAAEEAGKAQHQPAADGLMSLNGNGLAAHTDDDDEVVDLTTLDESPQLSATHATTSSTQPPPLSAPADDFLSLTAYEPPCHAEDRKRKSLASTNDTPAPAHQPSAKRRHLQQQQQHTNLGWLHSQHKDVHNRTLRLHEEILDFCSYVAPLPAEHDRRKQIIATITTLIQQLFPRAEVLPFGSFATHLYLPISDIDLCCFNIPDTHHGRSRLDIIAEELKRQNVASSIEVIAKARIPIIKLTEQQSNIKVDISFSVEGGITAAKFLNDQIGLYPAIRPLVLVLKYFLSCRLLNDTYSGGIGSFVLQMLVLSHLQHYQRQHHTHTHANAPINLGLLLLTFFELYGKSYNYYTTGIDVRHNGRYYNKMIEQRYNEQRPYLLSIINPLDANHDISSNSFGILKIRRAFYFAYQRLIALCNGEQPLQSSSMLSTVLSIDPEMKELRPLLDFMSQNIDLDDEDSDSAVDIQPQSPNKRVKLDSNGELPTPAANNAAQPLPEYAVTAEANQRAQHQLLDAAPRHGAKPAAIDVDDSDSDSSNSSCDDDSSVVITSPPQTHTHPPPSAAGQPALTDSFAQADDFVTLGTPANGKSSSHRSKSERRNSDSSGGSKKGSKKKKRSSSLSNIFSNSNSSGSKRNSRDSVTDLSSTGESKRSKKRSEREKKLKHSRKKQMHSD